MRLLKFTVLVVIAMLVITGIALAQSTRSVTLTWEAVTKHTNGVNLSQDTLSRLRYAIYYGIAPRGSKVIKPSDWLYGNAVEDITDTIVVIENLAVGATYYFAGTAYFRNVENTIIESDYSTELSVVVTPIVITIPPEIPMGLNINLNDVSSVSVNINMKGK